jgi:hypothetical protein
VAKNSRPDPKRELYKLAIAHKDVGAAESLCASYKDLIMSLSGENIPYHTNYAFMSGIVTAYARPFVDNKTVGVLKGPWSRFKSKEMQEAHATMIRMRHQVYAHSDARAMELFVVPPGVMMKGIGRVAPKASWRFVAEELEPMAIVGMHDCCLDLKTRLEEAVAALVDSVAAAEGTTDREFEIKW